MIFQNEIIALLLLLLILYKIKNVSNHEILMIIIPFYWKKYQTCSLFWRKLW
jgi:hypothetical protein